MGVCGRSKWKLVEHGLLFFCPRTMNIFYNEGENTLEHTKGEKKMNVNGWISYKKIKAKYGVKTVKEADEILDRIMEEFDSIVTDNSFTFALWNDSGTRRIGRSYHIDMEDKEENVVKVRSIFPEISERFQIAYKDMKLYRKMNARAGS